MRASVMVVLGLVVTLGGCSCRPENPAAKPEMPQGGATDPARDPRLPEHLTVLEIIDLERDTFQERLDASQEAPFESGSKGATHPSGRGALRSRRPSARGRGGIAITRPAPEGSGRNPGNDIDILGVNGV